MEMVDDRCRRGKAKTKTKLRPNGHTFQVAATVQIVRSPTSDICHTTPITSFDKL